jgi:hypothetical protein
MAMTETAKRLEERADLLVERLPRSGVRGALRAALTATQESPSQLGDLGLMVTWGSAVAVALNVDGPPAILVGSLAVGALSSGANVVRWARLRPQLTAVSGGALSAARRLVELAHRAERLEVDHGQQAFLEDLEAVFDAVVAVGVTHHRAGSTSRPSAQVRGQQQEVEAAVQGLADALVDLEDAAARRVEAFTLGTGLDGSAETLASMRSRVEATRSQAAASKELEELVVREVKRAGAGGLEELA